MGEIDGLEMAPQKIVAHPKGDIRHALKQGDAAFKGFGEAYFSEIHFGEIKGWKKHRRMWLNLVVPVGEVRFVLFDEAQNTFSEFTLGESNYARLTVPPGVWMAFEGLGTGKNLLLNIASIEHDPDEAENRPVGAFNFFENRVM